VENGGHIVNKSGNFPHHKVTGGSERQRLKLLASKLSGNTMDDSELRREWLVIHL